jgi:hypothetical protein
MLQVVSSENSFFRRTRISIATRNRSSANCYPSNRFNLAEALVACTSPFIRSTRDSDISAWTSHFVLGSPSTPHRRERESQAFEIPSASRRTRGKLRPMTRGDACRVYRKPRSAGVAEMPISGYHSRVVPPTNPVNNGRPGWADTDLTVARTPSHAGLSRSSSRDRCTLARTAPTTEGGYPLVSRPAVVGVAPGLSLAWRRHRVRTTGRGGARGRDAIRPGGSPRWGGLALGIWSDLAHARYQLEQTPVHVGRTGIRFEKIEISPSFQHVCGNDSRRGSRLARWGLANARLIGFTDPQPGRLLESATLHSDDTRFGSWSPRDINCLILQDRNSLSTNFSINVSSARRWIVLLFTGLSWKWITLKNWLTSQRCRSVEVTSAVARMQAVLS